MAQLSTTNHMVNANAGGQTESSVDRTVANPRENWRIEVVHVKKIMEAIKNSKNRKAPGNDGLQSILLKNLPKKPSYYPQDWRTKSLAMENLQIFVCFLWWFHLLPSLVYVFPRSNFQAYPGHYLSFWVSEIEFSELILYGIYAITSLELNTI